VRQLPVAFLQPAWWGRKVLIHDVCQLGKWPTGPFGRLSGLAGWPSGAIGPSKQTGAHVRHLGCCQLASWRDTARPTLRSGWAADSTAELGG